MAKKGYWIAHVNITDPERYKDYVAANAIAFKKYNARFVVRAGEAIVPKGGLGGRRHVVIEFDSFATAKACYKSPNTRPRHASATKPVQLTSSSSRVTRGR